METNRSSSGTEDNFGRRFRLPSVHRRSAPLSKVQEVVHKLRKKMEKEYDPFLFSDNDTLPNGNITLQGNLKFVIGQAVNPETYAIQQAIDFTKESQTNLALTTIQFAGDLANATSEVEKLSDRANDTLELLETSVVNEALCRGCKLSGDNCVANVEDNLGLDKQCALSCKKDNDECIPFVSTEHCPECSNDNCWFSTPLLNGNDVVDTSCKAHCSKLEDERDSAGQPVTGCSVLSSFRGWGHLAAFCSTCCRGFALFECADETKRAASCDNYQTKFTCAGDCQTTKGYCVDKSEDDRTTVINEG